MLSFFTFLQMPWNRKGVRSPNLFQEKEKRFDNAAGTVWKEMTLPTASKNFMFHVVWCIEFFSMMVYTNSHLTVPLIKFFQKKKKK